MLSRVTVAASQAESVSARTFGTSPDLNYSQDIWLHKDGAPFPTEFNIRLPVGVTVYPAGEYFVRLDTNLQGDKYNSLSFRPFSSTTLIPATPAAIAQYQKLSAQINDLLKK